MRLDVGLFGQVRHVALADVAGQPAALLGEHGHAAIVDHHRQAVLIDGRLAIVPDLAAQARPADLLPVGAIEAPMRVRGAGVVVEGLPLESQVQVVVIVGGLHREVDDRLLAFDRVGLQAPSPDNRLAQLLFLALMARNAAVALFGFPVGAFVLLAPQPLVAGLPGIEQRHRLGRNVRPIDIGGLCGNCWPCGNCRPSSKRGRAQH